MKLLTKQQHESYENAKFFYISKEIFENKYFKEKQFRKVRDHSHYTGEYRGAAHIVCNSKSNYDYHFIMKELAEEFRKQFTCLGENTEKYITFTVPTEKEV